MKVNIEVLKFVLVVALLLGGSSIISGQSLSRMRRNEELWLAGGVRGMEHQLRTIPWFYRARDMQINRKLAEPGLESNYAPVSSLLEPFQVAEVEGGLDNGISARPDQLQFINQLSKLKSTKRLQKVSQFSRMNGGSRQRGSSKIIVPSSQAKMVIGYLR